MYRTHTCGELAKKDKGQEVTLSGWVNSRRDHGGIIFIDLRDRSGLVQAVFGVENKELHKLAEGIRPEFVICVEGEVAKRYPEVWKNFFSFESFFLTLSTPAYNNFDQ